MAKKQTKRAKYLELRKLMRRADQSLSLFARKEAKRIYDNCPFCRENPIQVCFHFISRRRKATRWVYDNVIGACRRCNYDERYFPDKYRLWLINRRGIDVYKALVEKAMVPFYPDKEYLLGAIKTYNMGEKMPWR